MMSSSRNSLWLLLALFAALAAGPARADIFELADIAFVTGEEPGEYELTARLPEVAAVSGDIVWPEGCTPGAADRQRQGNAVQLSYELSCGRAISPGDTIRVPWELDGATFRSNVTGFSVQRNLAPAEGGMILPIGESSVTDRSLGAIAGDYSWQGIVHILMGWDHLAFVLCLCLLARGRELLLLVTTFTIGHSLSLALAFFEVIAVPIPPVEAVIALSIACMAREALRAGDRTHDRTAQMRYVVVVGAFGLLHGLGFASVLDELGVSPAERVSGLIFFNVGVEIGQLLFVGFVTGILWIAAQARAAAPVRRAALYGAGALGAFWMFERVASFGGGMA